MSSFGQFGCIRESLCTAPLSCSALLGDRADIKQSQWTLAIRDVYLDDGYQDPLIQKSFVAPRTKREGEDSTGFYVE
jgi:hypothetical protein